LALFNVQPGGGVTVQELIGPAVVTISTQRIEAPLSPPALDEAAPKSVAPAALLAEPLLDDAPVEAVCANATCGAPIVVTAVPIVKTAATIARVLVVLFMRSVLRK
jgi:hypothetical protein